MYKEAILSAWNDEMDRLNRRPWMSRLNRGQIELGHYMSVLVETYHNAGMNPQQQAFATMFLRGNPRDLIKKFYQHAISEIGHDLLALNDLKALGVEEDLVRRSKPLPTTQGFTAFPIYQVQLGSPLGYLGYLYHLERLPTRSGGDYIKMLKAKGVPDEALTFVEEHSTVDVAHNKMMDFYIEQMVTNEEQHKELVGAIKAAAKLHVLMLEGAFERVEEESNWLRSLAA